MLFKDFGYKP